MYTSTGSEGRRDAGQEKRGGEESRGLEKESKYMVSGVIKRKKKEREELRILTFVVPKAATVLPFAPTRLLSNTEPH